MGTLDLMVTQWIDVEGAAATNIALCARLVSRG
jgi:hypothetical protein